MGNNNITWAQLLKGSKPRGQGSVPQLQKMLWRLLRLAEERAWQSVVDGDDESLARFLHLVCQLGARWQSAASDAELAQKLDQLIAMRQGLGAVHGTFTVEHRRITEGSDEMEQVED